MQLVDRHLEMGLAASVLDRTYQSIRSFIYVQMPRRKRTVYQRIFVSLSIMDISKYQLFIRDLNWKEQLSVIVLQHPSVKNCACLL